MTGTGLHVTPLRRIDAAGGHVLHALKATETDFVGFGEAYFSTVEVGAIKSWRMHTRMTLNLVVPVGRVRFVACDAGATDFTVHTLGADDYGRLTVPPGYWLALQGLAAPASTVLNIADIEHDPDEVQRRELTEIPFEWPDTESP